MKNILVTGGSGFVGKQVVKELVEKGFKVAVLTRGRDVDIPSDMAEVIMGDLFNLEDISPMIKDFGPEAVVHLAWDVSNGFWESPGNIRWLNGSEKFLEHMLKIGVEKITLAGTCAEYDWLSNNMPLNEVLSKTKPATLYGKSKASLWNSLEVMSGRFGTLCANGRIFFPIGIGEQDFKLVSDVTTRLLLGGVAKVGGGRNRRDFIDVRDVGDALALISVSDVEGVVNIGNGIGLSIQEVMEMVLDAMGADLDYKIIYRAEDANGPNAATVFADIGRLENELGFRSSVPMSRCVRELVESIREAVNA